MENNFDVLNKKSFGSIEEANAYLDKFTKRLSSNWLSIPGEVAEKVSPEACILYAHFLGFNGQFYGSNVYLAEKLKCSTRSIGRLINELESHGCIKLVYINRTTRLIYPVYTMPFLYTIEQKRKDDEKINVRSSLGFNEL